ncbi:MAG: glycosyltransferase [Candidatus Aureabacteria bacterium]|nr:glycosyltransferase [Candidatus Auribacterota bacterium]
MIDYSVIIPSFNEETWLPKSLKALNEAMKKIDFLGEVIVVDNNSSDKTSKVAKEYGAKVVFEPVNQISRARNKGGNIAKGKYLVFLDADTVLSKDLLQDALKKLSTGTCCGGGVIVTMDKPIGFFAGTLMSLWTFASVKFSLAAGCFVFCLRQAFDDIGGFSEKVYASEEIWFSRNMFVWGKKRKMSFDIITDHPVTTSNRRIENPIRAFLMVFVLILFPFGICFKSVCSLLWYNKEQKKI